VVKNIGGSIRRFSLVVEFHFFIQLVVQRSIFLGACWRESFMPFTVFFHHVEQEIAGFFAAKAFFIDVP